MPTIAAQSHLSANLASLGQRNAELAQLFASVPPHPGLILEDSAQNVSAGSLHGRPLCSRHRPLDEADRLVRDIDLVEHAAIVVLGFGLGYHVQKLAERSSKATLIVVFEPDLALLRAVLQQIDHSKWMCDALVLIVTDADDRGTLARKLEGGESILGQGVQFVEHPASRERLGEHAARFARTFSDHVSAAKVTLATTLMRSTDTVRNLMLNVDHYAAGHGMAELQNVAAGFPAVVVSAGPSLHKNIHQLALPGVRDRCVIVAVQTTLKPLLAAGIKPHFVTALDYHEISRRFYEDLNPDDVRDVTLIADAKAHPVILDVYPGPIRCCANSFLDKLLGPMMREMGDLPAGATVAHLAVYVARFLGCNPVAVIGQDLGFPDGLYYAPGAAIHDIWAPELNPFNTLAMMEWQRIVRHRLHLIKTRDVHGRSIFTDAQMHTYLQQFERDFARYAEEGLTIIDATEGGVAKQHAVAMPLRDVLSQHATRALPAWPIPSAALDEARIVKARSRLNQVRSEVQKLRDLSTGTQSLLNTMLQEQHDPVRMASHFRRIEANRREVEQRLDTLELLNQLNQMGVFRRLKADRRLHMQPALDPVARQRLQLERDAENVAWIADAATEMIEQIDLSLRVLDGEQVHSRPRTEVSTDDATGQSTAAETKTIAAMIAIDPERNGMGVPRSLAERFGNRSVLQATLERLGRSTTLKSIILIVPEGFDIDALIDRAKIRLPIEIERIAGSPFGPEHAAIAVARLWADTSWRGGIAGMSVYDEVLCPQIMHLIMLKRGLDAAIIAGPDWPLISVTGDGGCDALVRRHLENPEKLNLVFTQAPPGMCGCLVSATLMAELAQRNRLSTVGGLLTYQPHAPQHDPIARDLNVQIDSSVRNSLIRATFDSPRQRSLLTAAFDAIESTNETDAKLGVTTIAACVFAPNHTSLPQHLTLELTTNRTSRGVFAQSLGCPAQRPMITIDAAKANFAQLLSGGTGDVTLTLHGAGDPLLHPHFDDILRAAKDHGIAGVHIRTELLTDHRTLDRLLASGVDVISVDLNADRAATYQAMMGFDRFKEVLLNIEYLLEHRRKLTSQPGTAAFALPWVVPHLQRRLETYEDIDSFYDRWQAMLGTVVIDDPSPNSDGSPSQTELTPAITPQRVVQRDLARTMTILCDGSVPPHPHDFSGANCVGNAEASSIQNLWRDLLAQRFSAIHA